MSCCPESHHCRAAALLGTNSSPSVDYFVFVWRQASSRRQEARLLRTCTWRSVQAPLATNTEPPQSLPGPAGKPLNCHHRNAELLAEGKRWEGARGRRAPTRPLRAGPRRDTGPGEAAPAPSRCSPAPRYQLPVEILGAQREQDVQRLLQPLRHTEPSVILSRLPPQPPPFAQLHRGAAPAAGQRSRGAPAPSPAPCQPRGGTAAPQGVLPRPHVPSDPPGNSPGWQPGWLGLARFGCSVLRGARTALRSCSWPPRVRTPRASAPLF